MKKRKVQEGLDNEDEKKEEGFGKDLKQAWYERSPMQSLRINTLFQIAEIARENGN